MRFCFNQLSGPDADSTQKAYEEYAEKIQEKFSQEKKYAEMVEAVCAAMGISSEVVEEQIVEFD